MPETISPTIAGPKPDQDAIIAVPIANLDSFLPVWSRAISARAVNFASRADDPSMLEVTIGRGFATYEARFGYWVPTLVQPYPTWMDSPSAAQ